MDYTNSQLRVIYGDGSLGVAGPNFHYLFSYERGGLESLVVDNKDGSIAPQLRYSGGQLLITTVEIVLTLRQLNGTQPTGSPLVKKLN